MPKDIKFTKYTSDPDDIVEVVTPSVAAGATDAQKLAWLSDGFIRGTSRDTAPLYNDIYINDAGEGLGSRRGGLQ